MAILSHDELFYRIKKEKANKERLWVTPLLDPKQIGDSSIDVRLGNEFIIIRQSNLMSMDPSKREEIEKHIGQYQERVRVRLGENFILHPNQFVLSSTQEYIGLPHNLTAQVEGRSSWGRLGLIIATATPVAPGFKGVITLELINGGQAPLVLYPGMIIAQLVISKTTSDVEYKGRYNFPTGPEFSRIHQDRDMKFWGDEKYFI